MTGAGWRRALLLCAVLPGLLSCVQREPPSAASQSGAGRPEIDAVFGYWDQPGSPGCALGVAQDGEPVYSRGYGFANLDNDIPVAPDSVFDVGSLTKQVVAASVVTLAQDGKLSLDDSVREWLPELPANTQPISIEHMLYHMSGFRDYLNLFPLAGRDHYFPISHPQILAMMARQRELVFPPGEQYLYSNTAYMLLAQVIERASGQNLGDFAAQYFFEPLGMSGTLMYDNYEEIIPRRAIGYDRDDDIGGEVDVRMVHNFNFDVPGDGQMYTTVEDLLRWDHFLHQTGQAGLREEMLTEGRLNDGEHTGYAKGLFLDDYRGLQTVGHTGSSWGARAVLLRFVESRLSIAITCNDGTAEPQQLAFRLADLLLADELDPPAVKGTADEPGQGHEPAEISPMSSSGQLPAYEGQYYSEELDAIYRLASEGGVLQLRIEQEPPLSLRHTGENRFEANFEGRAYWEPSPATLVFRRGENDAVAGFELTSGSERGIVFDKRL